MENNGKQLDILSLANGVVNYYWKSSTSTANVDHTARTGAANRLILYISKYVNNCSQEDAQADILSLLEKDKEFRCTIETIVESSVTTFKEHYIKFGGKAALFVHCLLLCLDSDSNTNIYKAKVSFINWYAQDRKNEHSMVNGGMVAAWWPFEWFSLHFNEIASSVVAAAIYSLTKATYRKIKDAFFQQYKQVKSSCKPFPKQVLIAKPADQTMGEFKESLDKLGLIDNFFYIFNLSDNEIEKLLGDWNDALQRFQKTLDTNEINLLYSLLK
ncbi:MAG: hypothetical protein HQK96_19520, partial [Nitrospirae bacterium]|nr:hypothetical protein [Nitrospirota bacterium]